MATQSGGRGEGLPLRPIARNKKAFFQYEVLTRLECGLALRGTEVKSLRAGTVDFADSFAQVKDGRLMLLGLHIAEYAQGNRANHVAARTRALLAHKRQIRKLQSETQIRGLTLVPLSLYWKGSRAKVEIGVVRGKRQFDKRETIQKRELQREKSRREKFAGR